MSTPVVSTPVSKSASAVKDVKEKKPRTPTLPAKFGKFIQFGYWFMKHINSLDEEVPAVDQDLCIEQLKVFADVESQQAFVQGFFDESKDVAKTIRTMIQQKKRDEVKAAKLALKEQAKAQTKSEKKPRAPRQKKEKDASEPADDSESKDKKPRGRKPKAKVLTSEDAFVNEIVQLATADKIPTPVASPSPKVKETKPVNETKEKPVKETKEKPVKETKEKPVKETKEKPVKETKEKPVKETKEKPVKAKDNKAKKNPDDSEQTAVSVLNLHDKQYLIDDQNKVYDFHSHLPLGTFNPNTLTITESK